MFSKTINSSNIEPDNNVNQSKSIHPGDYSLLQLFVENDWEKNEIKNLAKWLKLRGVDVHKKLWHPLFSRHYSNEDRHGTDEDLFKARITSELKNVLPLLLKCNDNVNFTNENDQTILHLYVANCESNYRYSSNRTKFKVLGIVRSLIEKGASVYAVDKRGKTPLHIALEMNKLEILRLMLELSSKVDACDEMGNTMLRTVIEKFGEDNVGLDIVRILLGKGADPNRKNKEGQTSLDIALRSNNNKLLRIILEFGGNINDRNAINLLARCRTDARAIVIEHALKLRALAFPIDKVYEQQCEKVYLGDKESALCWIYTKYSKEVTELKNCMINSGVSIYQFLHMSSRCQHALAEFLPQDLKFKFPIYANFILAICNEAVRRNWLLEPAKLAWNQVTDMNWPDVCVERILFYLSNWDLEVLVDAAENKDCDLISMINNTHLGN